jgi:response regulator RpfG family c-di-GMP phosphodiesterase
MKLKDAKVLFVDDDPMILSGFVRNFRRYFNVYIAPDAESALEYIKNDGPFAVAVSDMKMPGMNGVVFFEKLRKVSPDTVRIMLSGEASLDMAVDAMNSGAVYKFLIKPVSPDEMLKIIALGLEEHNRISGGKRLLDETLNGSVQALMDVLVLTNPIAFSRGKRLRHYIFQLGRMIGIQNIWIYEIAAMLSQIGCVTVSEETVEKFVEGEELDDKEQRILKFVPQISKKVIAKIPGLDLVSEIIENQNTDIDYSMVKYPLNRTPQAILGSLLLKTVTEFDNMICAGLSKTEAISRMSYSDEKNERTLLKYLKDVSVFNESPSQIRLKKIDDLREGMILAEDIKTNKGFLIAPKGYEADKSLISRLEDYSRKKIIKDSVHVFLFGDSVCFP